MVVALANVVMVLVQALVRVFEHFAAKILPWPDVTRFGPDGNRTGAAIADSAPL
jgi:hypothetical protein